MTSTTARRTSDAAARRALAAANVFGVIVERGMIVADSKPGATVQAARLTCALIALADAGLPTQRDEDYPIWMAHLAVA